MSLIEYTPPSPLGRVPPKEPFVEPAEVLITPCDPWPRPYFLEHGLRRVHPYHFTFNTYVKERWRGRTILDVFCSEFRDRTAAYYEKAITDGAVVVDGKTVPTDYILKNGSLIVHTTHRHEPPVSAEPIAVIHEDEDLIVINKPCGIPVHPSGRYSFNSVVEVMRAERGYMFNPLPANRLDRLTSGIMFIAKHPKAAEDISKQIASRSVRKEYLARVNGRFPDGDEVICEEPILAISPKLGLNRVRATGKTAKTVFKRIAYFPPPDNEESDEETQATPENVSRPWQARKGFSVIRARPVTGRTHQIRVHLQYLGYPIANDSIYANQSVWGIDLGKGDADGMTTTDEDIITRLSRMGKEDVASAIAYHDTMVDEYNKTKAEKMNGEQCEVCNTPLYSDPGPHELCLWLHSYKYEDAEGKWSYTSPLPAWALPPGMTDIHTMEELEAAYAGTSFAT